MFIGLKLEKCCLDENCDMYEVIVLCIREQVLFCFEDIKLKILFKFQYKFKLMYWLRFVDDLVKSGGVFFGIFLRRGICVI